MRHAEALAPGLLVVVDVDADDHVGAGEPQALDDVEADAAEAEDDRRRARLDLGGVDDGADAGGDAAADVADLVEGRVRIDLRHRDLRQHGEVREGRAAHVVEDLVAAAGEARRAVRHHALPLRGADRGAEIGLARQAGRALAAFGRVERDDVIALAHAGHAGADIDHDARALMAEDGGKEPLRIGAREGELVGVADAGRLDLDQNLARARAVEIDLHDLERLSGGDGDGGAGFHGHGSIGVGRARLEHGVLRGNRRWGHALASARLISAVVTSSANGFPGFGLTTEALQSYGDWRFSPDSASRQRRSPESAAKSLFPKDRRKRIPCSAELIPCSDA